MAGTTIPQWRINAVVSGEFRRSMSVEATATVEGAKDGVRATTEAYKAAARAIAARGFPGGKKTNSGSLRVGNAIRDKYYIRTDATLTGLVYSKFGRKGDDGKFIDYFAAHAKGATLRSKRPGGFMVIPFKGTSRALPKIRRDLDNLGTDPKLALIRQGPGRFIFVRHTSMRRSLLIATLIRVTRLQKRLDFEPAKETARRDLPVNVITAIDRRAREAGQGGIL